MNQTPQATQHQRSRLDPEPVARRDFLGLASACSAGLAMLFALVGMLRLPNAAVLASPSKRFPVQVLESLAPGQPYIPPGRSVAMLRDSEGVYAVSLVCTHLGCIVKTTTDGFECPCHGSRFKTDGSVTKGPAPQSLPWLKVTGEGGKYVVDEQTTVPAGTKVSA